IKASPTVIIYGINYSFWYTVVMREIEVKARVSNIKILIDTASKMGIYFGKTIIQEDTIFEPDIPKEDPNWNIFRIRKQDDKFLLNMKHKASQSSQDNHELESLIDNSAEVAHMLDRLGYSFGVNIRKKRRIAKYNNLEICLDEVYKLGNFIEIEMLCKNEVNVADVQLQLWDVLLKLGIKPKDRVYKGYDTLMHEYLSSK
ncbi:MAG: adenylate cyclase, class 2, partial [Patescibacteria group bacterium]|nr:adenylate cyclase, class 2 [Patescibacteria group bacterium]